MTADERLILERREQGQEWAEIAGSPDAIRVRLSRVTRQLGLDDDDG